MPYITDRKRVTGLGSAKAGTEHHWAMTVSSVGLLFLVPLFVFTVGPMLGRPHAEVVAYFGRPFPAVVAGLTFVVGLMHFKSGAQVLWEDYTKGFTRKAAILATICVCYAAAATAVFALAKLAL